MAAPVNSADTNNHFITVKTPGAGDAPRLTLEWHNVELSVAIKNSQTKQVEHKQILNSVSGRAQPGELLVIMGPSGAGKSSLLDCIAGRNRNTTSGHITVNGAPWNKNLKRFAAYVMQDDLFYETITVREHLMFQARLRMGKSHSVLQYTTRVDEVMEELGLTKCRDTFIGGTMLRGISGGERKRLSFATELLTNPSLLFVDEPTSGLDSYMAETIVLQLQQLAQEGRTVVVTIHQPSSELFKLFDTLYLLADGSTVYHGKAAESVSYFAKLGFQCPGFVNPTDFFMRQLVVLDKDKDDVGVQRVQLLKDAWATSATSDSSTVHSTSATTIATEQDPRLGALGQMIVLMQRNFLRLVRDRIAFRVTLFQSLFLALIFGLIYLQLDLDQKGIQNFAGAFFVIVVNQTFGAASPVFVAIPTELPMILREYRAGLYRLVVWFVSKNLSELPVQILMPVVFFVPIYFLIGFGQGLTMFLEMQLMVILINFAAIGLGYMVACIARRVEIAPVVGIIILLPFMLFGGLFLNSDDTPSYFVWMQYISPVKYGFEGFMKIFWHKIDALPCVEGKPCLATSGDGMLEYYSIDSFGGSAWGDALLLLALGLAFRLIGLAALWWNVRGQNK